jgi:hypothetical protein
MLIGYARVSSRGGQETAAQVAALKAAGCERIYREQASGGRWDGPVISSAKADVLASMSKLRQSVAVLEVGTGLALTGCALKLSEHWMIKRSLRRTRRVSNMTSKAS